MPRWWVVQKAELSRAGSELLDQEGHAGGEARQTVQGSELHHLAGRVRVRLPALPHELDCHLASGLTRGAL
jgi:hypothetical protein